MSEAYVVNYRTNESTHTKFFHNVEEYHEWMDTTEGDRHASQMGRRIVLVSIDVFYYVKGLDVNLENAASVKRVIEADTIKKREELLAKKAEIEKQLEELDPA